MTQLHAIIPAAGRGLRMGRNRPKQFLDLSGKSILGHTLEALEQTRLLAGIILVVPHDFMDDAKELVEEHSTRYKTRGERMLPIAVVEGGAERQDSVYNGLRHLPADCEWVIIHDGVRPFASPKLFETAWRAAGKTGASITALPATDTVKRVGGERVLETLPREEIWLVQTPQVFRRDILLEAYDRARNQGWSGTDDASFVERMGVSVSVVPGERSNIKVTTPEDLDWAEWFLRGRVGDMGKKVRCDGCG